MIEEQIEIVVLVADLEMVLAADEGEALAEFEDQGSKVLDERAFQVALEDFRTERQEVEGIGILDDLLGQGRLFGRQRAREVGQRATLACEQVALDLVGENVAAPAVLDRLARVPGAFRASRRRVLWRQ
jgi:hypothetical protein